MKKIISLILALALSLTLIFIVSCDKDNTDSTEDTGNKEQPAASPWDSARYTENTAVGTGNKTFTLIVSAYNKEITLTVKTDENTVGAALSALDIVEGEEGAYGLYIKKVNNILADYDVDQTYWAFYINGEYAMTGVDKTDIVAGATYKLAREK